jgi:hypothetical protein
MTEIDLDRVVVLLDRLMPHLQGAALADTAAVQLSEVLQELKEHRDFWSIVPKIAKEPTIAVPTDSDFDIHELSRVDKGDPEFETMDAVEIAQRTFELSFALMSALPGDPTIYPPRPQRRSR